MTNDIYINILPETLSDGSEVYNVAVMVAGLPKAMFLHAVTYKEAYAMADKMRDAINTHTTQMAFINDRT